MSPTSPIPRSANSSRPHAQGFDYLVNAAGILRVKPILEVTVEEWRTIQTVNAESVFFLCQLIGARLNPGGAVVNLSSSSAKLATSVDVAAYAASKTTILSITRSFAYALADRPVRVNAICPGHRRHARCRQRFLAGVAAKRAISRRRARRAAQESRPAQARRQRRRMRGPHRFLLSDAAAYMTGQAINFTGGLVNW